MAISSGLSDGQIARLTDWTDRNIPEIGSGALHCTPLSGGSSNDIFRIDRGGVAAVLRRPRSGGDRIIDREARLLRALHGSSIPHATLLGHCEDDAVLGGHFIVSSLIEGDDGPHVMESCADFSAQEASEVAFAVIDAAARLAAFDYQAAGLGDFGKPEGFLERQVDRWMAMLEAYGDRPDHRPRPIPGLDVVIAWLRENIPPAARPALMHGDIGFSNAIFSTGRPRRLLAMLDWETATIGDPLLDLARAILPMSGEGRPHYPTSLHDYRHFPTREALARAYSAATGRVITNLDYYVVLAHFKLAVILERHHATAEAGEDPGGQARMLSHYALELFQRAQAIIEKRA